MYLQFNRSQSPADAAKNSPLGKPFLINLRRRPDRLARFRQLQADNGWKLAEPVVVEAVEGDKVGVPTYFLSGGGAWGCLRSHIAILEYAIMKDLGTIFVMEDDVTWHADAWDRLAAFVEAVPDDWHQLMLGGQHIQTPEVVCPGVLRCRDTERTHAYALRGPAIKSLLTRWYASNVHCDWTMGRDWQKDWNVYAPDPFVFGQGGGRSDISGRDNATNFWTAPTGVAVVHLVTPGPVVRQLRGYGLHTGYQRNEQDLDTGLCEVVGSAYPQAALKHWLDVVLWEAGAEGKAVAVWHPGITFEQVKAVWPEAIPIKGDTVEECLQQAKGLSLKENVTATHLVVLRASKAVAEALPWHLGYWRDAVTGYDNGLRHIATLKERAAELAEWVQTVGNEAERKGSVPCLWHPDIGVDEVQAATSRRVVEIAGENVEECLIAWAERK